MSRRHPLDRPGRIGRRSGPTGPLPLPAFLALLALLAAGCGLETPQAPRFQTDLHLPLGRFTYTVEELLEREESLETDTTGAVLLRVDRSFDPITLRDSLYADVPTIDLVASVGEIPLEIPAPPEVRLRAQDLVTWEIPPGGLQAPIPPFTIPLIESALPPFEEYREGSIRSGSITLRIDNGLPVGIDHLTIRIVDLALGRTIDTFGVSEPIPSGGSGFLAFDLGGRRIGNHLRVDLLSGSSSGSAAPVFLHPDDSLRLRATFDDLRFDELEAPIPPRRFETIDSTRVDEPFRIDRARVDRAEVTLRLESRLPLEAAIVVSLPDVSEDGEIWMRRYRMHAGSLEDPARLDVVETLEGAEIVLPARDDGQPLRYRLEVETEGSGGAVVRLDSAMRAAVGIEPFRITLASLTGLFPPREVTVDPIRIAVDIPDEINGVAFVEADLIAQLENGIPLPATADFEAQASGSESRHVVRIDGEIAAGEQDRQVGTRLVVDESEPGLLDLLNALPEEILLRGSLRIGDPQRTVTLHADDSVRGAITLRAPASVRVEDAEYRPDPFRIEVSQSTREQIRDRIEEAVAGLRVVNRLPVGLTARLQFAADSAGVYDVPSLRLRKVTIPAAALDPATGRVIEPVVSEHEIGLTHEDVLFFAREELFGGVFLTAAPTGPDLATLGIDDAIEVDGMLRIRVRVDDRP
ncbi:MAG: hypothetical protein GF346_03750 [Candidatus Eisenbacteria bacterium]|nr:hypothetical protein [Candidatus Latescibacterota bacterium]MBD3301538.1 hypothetical protein [Candidatus Eisenbacteria bacterium]